MNERWHEIIVRNRYCYGAMESRIGGRPENQDYFGCSDTSIGLLLVVCDGMGGGPGGALASSEATKEIINFVKKANNDSLDKEEIIREAIQNANTHLLHLQYKDKALVGMGTTCVALLFDEQQAIAAHVGDSRIYQMRLGEKIWRTFDHSKVMELTASCIDNYTEEDARKDPNNNIITRALGISEDIDPAISVRPYEKGDRFALCTDGVWSVMPEPQLIKLLNHSNSIDGTVEKTMITVQDYGLTNKHGLHDNFTLVLAETTCNSNLIEEKTHKPRFSLRVLFLLLGICLLLIIIFFNHKPESDRNGPLPNIVTDSISNITIEDPNNTSRIDTYDSLELEIQVHKDSIVTLWDTIFSLRKRNRDLIQSIKKNEM